MAIDEQLVIIPEGYFDSFAGEVIEYLNKELRSLVEWVW